MYGFFENIDIFKETFPSLFLPIEAYATVLRGSVLENYINNLLTLFIWKYAYDRIVYIVKKDINIFSKKGVLRGGHTFFFSRWIVVE